LFEKTLELKKKNFLFTLLLFSSSLSIGFFHRFSEAEKIILVRESYRGAGTKIDWLACQTRIERFDDGLDQSILATIFCYLVPIDKAKVKHHEW
jgi:hypothetical protein